MRWKNRPEGSNWGDFGPDDQLGSLNHIGPQQIIAAAAEIVTGRNFCLSLPLSLPGGSVLAPHRRPPQLHSNIRHGKPYFNYETRQESPRFRDVCCDDSVTLSTQYSTQWDSLAHVGSLFDADGDGIAEPRFYNGYRASVDIFPPEIRGERTLPLSIDNMAVRPIQGRGVLIDLERHFGRERTWIGANELLGVVAADRIPIEKGDILCLHTGFADEIIRMAGKPDPERVHRICAVLDGTDQALLDWISSSGIAAIAADNYAVEGLQDPTGPCSSLVPLHHHCLFKRGMPLGELWSMTELAAWLRAHGRHRFFLSAPPLRLPGAVGSPVTPVATV